MNDDGGENGSPNGGWPKGTGPKPMTSPVDTSVEAVERAAKRVESKPWSSPETRDRNCEEAALLRQLRSELTDQTGRAEEWEKKAAYSMDLAVELATVRERELALVKAATDPAYGFNGVWHDNASWAEFFEVFDRQYNATLSTTPAASNEREIALIEYACSYVRRFWTENTGERLMSYADLLSAFTAQYPGGK